MSQAQSTYSVYANAGDDFWFPVATDVEHEIACSLIVKLTRVSDMVFQLRGPHPHGSRPHIDLEVSRQTVSVGEKL